MVSVKLGNITLSLDVIPDDGNKMRQYVRIEGHLSLSDILLYLVIDGLIWFSLFAMVLL